MNYKKKKYGIIIEILGRIKVGKWRDLVAWVGDLNPRTSKNALKHRSPEVDKFYLFLTFFFKFVPANTTKNFIEKNSMV